MDASMSYGTGGPITASVYGNANTVMLIIKDSGGAEFRLVGARAITPDFEAIAALLNAPPSAHRPDEVAT